MTKGRIGITPNRSATVAALLSFGLTGLHRLRRSGARRITSLRRREKSRGLAHWYEREIDAILKGVGTAFPRSLRLEDQGRFALGYHHQRTWKRDSGQAADPAADDAGAEEG